MIKRCLLVAAFSALVGCNLLFGESLRDDGTLTSVNGDVPNGTAIPDGGFLPPIPPVEGECVNERKLCPDKTVCVDYRDPRNGCSEPMCAACPGATDVCYQGKCTTPCAGDGCGVVDVAADQGFVCMVRASGALVCFGGSTPAGIPTTTNFAHVAVDETWGSCATTKDGILSCWSSTTVVPQTATASPPTSAVTSFCVGYRPCAIESGSLVCWGPNGGTGSALIGGQYSEVVSASSNICAVKTSGQIVCEGDAPPITMGHGLSVSTGGIDPMFCAIDETTSNGACWGTAGLIVPAAPLKQIVAGPYGLACAIKQDDTITCWNAGPDTSKSNNISILLTPPPGTFTKIAIAYATACGITTDAKLVCWGDTGEIPP